MISYSEEHRSDIMVEGNDQRTTAAYGTFRFIGSGDIMIDYNDKHRCRTISSFGITANYSFPHAEGV